ncbi:MSHA biogenesis protein MshK [Vibrio mediterranei]
MVRAMFIAFLSVSMSSWAIQDPTAPLGWAEPTQVQTKPKKKVVYRLPTLQSIVCEQAMPCSAVMNDKVVEKGDVINGYKVVNINSENLFLQRAGKQWKLGLFAMDVKN